MAEFLGKDRILSNHEYDVHYYGGGRRHILYAMELYAKQQAIAFAKWCAEMGWEKYIEEDLWKNRMGYVTEYTTEQLYDLFIEQIKQPWKIDVADVIYALTNEKGKNRSERANDKYYDGIKKYSGYIFVKLCDRIANVQYSKLTKSRMFEMYKTESFIEKINPPKEYTSMVYYLNQLFDR